MEYTAKKVKPFYHLLFYTNSPETEILYFEPEARLGPDAETKFWPRPLRDEALLAKP